MDKWRRRYGARKRDSNPRHRTFVRRLLSEKDARAALDILIEQLGVPEAQLTPDARLQQDLGADSLTIMEITMAVEERFNLSIPDEEWEKVSTVGDLFEALAELLSKPDRRDA